MTPRSLALHMEELVDKLGLGAKFYVVGYSMGGQATWGVLKYIPHSHVPSHQMQLLTATSTGRLAGVALIAPVINYWWPGFPANLSTEGYHWQPPQDQY
ncbi:hypothetical protein NL676_037426 [Syzygium grande]|nr:hypothetical protein NL676_037426 [Syzygium grande]